MISILYTKIQYCNVKVWCSNKFLKIDTPLASSLGSGCWRYLNIFWYKYLSFSYLYCYTNIFGWLFVAELDIWQTVMIIWNFKPILIFVCCILYHIRIKFFYTKFSEISFCKSCIFNTINVVYFTRKLWTSSQYWYFYLVFKHFLSISQLMWITNKRTPNSNLLHLKSSTKNGKQKFDKNE